VAAKKSNNGMAWLRSAVQEPALSGTLSSSMSSVVSANWAAADTSLVTSKNPQLSHRRRGAWP